MLSFGYIGIENILIILYVQTHTLYVMNLVNYLVLG